MTSSQAMNNRLFWILRVACAGCFIGHGVFGIITKVDWLPYFFVGNITPTLAYRLMPLIGSFDIMMGILILIWPCPIILIWMTCWGTLTAFLRPLADQGSWEFFERAGNFGVPFTFLLLSGWFENKMGLFEKIRLKPVSVNLWSFAKNVLIWTTASLLIGHGAFMVFMKKDLFVYQFLNIGMTVSKEYLVLAGIAEIGMGMLVFFWQPPVFLMLIFIWKIATELLYPLSGFPIWEFIERGGSYGAPLALLYLNKLNKPGH